MKASVEKSGEEKKKHEASPTFSLTHHWSCITERRNKKQAAKITKRICKCYRDFALVASRKRTGRKIKSWYGSWSASRRSNEE